MAHNLKNHRPRVSWGPLWALTYYDVKWQCGHLPLKASHWVSCWNAIGTYSVKPLRSAYTMPGWEWCSPSIQTFSPNTEPTSSSSTGVVSTVGVYCLRHLYTEVQARGLARIGSFWGLRETICQALLQLLGVCWQSVPFHGLSKHH